MSIHIESERGIQGSFCRYLRVWRLQFQPIKNNELLSQIKLATLFCHCSRSDTINANLGEAQRTLAAAKKKIVTFAVEVHEQLKRECRYFDPCPLALCQT